MQTNKYASIAAFSVAWIVLAYLSKYTSGAAISFYLPILVIFTVPLLFTRNDILAIGAIGGALGTSYLISGGFQSVLSTLVFTVGVMMLGTYYIAPKSLAEMKRASDWIVNIVLTAVLLAIGETLAAAGSSGSLSAAFSASEATILGGVVLAFINCILLRFLAPSLRKAKTSEKRVIATPVVTKS